MKILFRPDAVWNAPDGGAGGAGASPAAAPASGAAPAAGATPAAAGQAAPSPAQNGGTHGTGQAADYWPDGLDQALKGTDGKATLDNLAKALNGYRTRDAQRGVPEKPEAYADIANLKDAKINPANAPHFEALKNDPAFGAMAKAAHQHGIGQKAFAEVYDAGLNALSEAGLLLPDIDPAAEKAALVPDDAKALPPAAQEQAVQRRLNDNFAFLDLMVQNRGMPQEVRDYMQLNLGDTAKGHRAIEWVKAQLQAGGAGPGGHGNPAGGAADTPETLRAERAKILPNDPDRAKKEAALDARYQKLYGN